MAVLFDIDDTLLDDRGAQEVYLGRLYSNHRSELSLHEDEFRRSWRRSIAMHFARYLRGEMSITDQRRARIRDVFDRPDMTDRDADRIVAEFLAEYEASWRLFPDVLPVLTECIFVGDDWDRDIEGARRAGLSAVWLRRFDLSNDPERARVPSMQNLTELIERTDMRRLVGLEAEAG